MCLGGSGRRVGKNFGPQFSVVCSRGGVAKKEVSELRKPFSLSAATRQGRTDHAAWWGRGGREVPVL